MPENTLTLEMTVERTTPGTVRYAEDVGEDGTPILRTLYIQKWAVAELGNPQRVRVTVEAI